MKILPTGLYSYVKYPLPKGNIGVVEVSEEFLQQVTERKADLGEYLTYKYTPAQIEELRSKAKERLIRIEQETERKSRIAECRAFLKKITEDEAQIKWGLIVPDIAEKRKKAAEMVNELRAYENKPPKEKV
ncbi:MAG TPA: hypothetical protein GX745_01990 [Clostridiales bacterium]|nr:hypothetical protein [Clostridiales bacterium]